MGLQKNIEATIRDYLGVPFNSPLSISSAELLAEHGKFVVYAHGHNRPGVIFDAHTHKTDHMGVVCGGRVALTLGDEEKIVGNGHTFFVPKDLKHSITSLDPNVTVLCIFYGIE